jgi:FkbM family methyltransferase
MQEILSIIKLNIYNILRLRFIFHIILWKNLYFVFSLLEFKIYRVNHPKRSLRYKKTIKERVTKVGVSYNLDKIDFTKFKEEKLNILDCGANIGEVGSYFEFKKIKFQYFCFEPLETAYKCLRFNHPNAKIFKIGLSNKNETKTFFVKNDTNDNSLVVFDNYDFTTDIQCEKLENITEINALKFIHILKIDGEGYEPEIIEGATKILNKICYISVDCGAERNNEKTDELVKKILKNNFELIFQNPKRDTLLFKNNSFF